MSFFNCCGSNAEYQPVPRDIDPPQTDIDETDGKELDAMTSADLADLAQAADIHKVPETVEIEEKKEEVIVLEVIADADDKDPNAPIETWGTQRVLDYFANLPANEERHRKEQAKAAKVIRRLVELSEAKQQALQILESGGLNLLLGFFRRLEGKNAMQKEMCHAIQFLCSQPEADQYEFPSNGAAPLKDVVVANREHVPTLIASLDCLGVFTRISEEYVQSTLDAGVVALLFELLQGNLNNVDQFPLQISLTRVVGAIARAQTGRSALGDQCVSILLNSMRRFDQVQNLISNCTEALWYLCQEVENCNRAIDEQISDILTETMRNRFVGQDLHTKVITLLHQIVSKEGVPDKLVTDSIGVKLLGELLQDNAVVSENYVIILQVWIALLHNANNETRGTFVDDRFLTARLPAIATVIASDNMEARESALTLLLMILQIAPDAVNSIVDDPKMIAGLLNAPQGSISADALQCLMVIYFKLTSTFEYQALLFDGGIMSFLASDWYLMPDISGQTIKSAAGALVRLYSNPSYHQELDDKVSDLQNLVAQRQKFPDADDILGELDAAMFKINQLSSVIVTVARPIGEDEKDGEGEGIPLKGPASVNVKLSVNQHVEVFSKSQDTWIDGTIRDISDGRICVVYANREKWLKQTSKQWRPVGEQIAQAARTRSGTTTRPRNEEEPTSGRDDEENSQDYDNGEPGAATETEGPMIPRVELDVNADDIIANVAGKRLDSPRPPDTQSSRPTTRRQTQADATEMDFDVKFPDQKLGLELRPGENNSNCVVSRCLSDFTRERVDAEAYVIQVNGQWVKDLPFDTIYQIIVTATKNPPLTLMFRSKKDRGDEDFLNRLAADGTPGRLKIHVVEALQLMRQGRYAKVKINGQKEQTESVAASDNPSWTETLFFENYQPVAGQAGQVVVYAQRGLLKDPKVGSARFELPTQFYKLERHSLELLDKKEKLAGSVSVTAILTQDTDRESHAMRDIRLSVNPTEEFEDSMDEMP